MKEEFVIFLSSIATQNKRHTINQALDQMELATLDPEIA